MIYVSTVAALNACTAEQIDFAIWYLHFLSPLGGKTYSVCGDDMTVILSSDVFVKVTCSVASITDVRLVMFRKKKEYILLNFALLYRLK